MDAPIQTLRPEQAFAGKTRVIKVKGQGKGRRGLVVENDLITGVWQVLFDDTKILERANPYEFAAEQKGSFE